MYQQLRRLKGLLAAIVVLAVSAGMVLGADPLPDGDKEGSSTSDAAHMGVPAGFKNHGQFVSCVARLRSDGVQVDPSTLTPAACEDVAGQDELKPEDEGADGHGALVSKAAGMATPQGFKNHGHFVSCVARMNKGQLGPDVDLSGVDPATLTPAACEREGKAPKADDQGEPVKAGKAKKEGQDGTGPGKGTTKGKAKGEAKGHAKGPKDGGEAPGG